MCEVVLSNMVCTYTVAARGPLTLQVHTPLHNSDLGLSDQGFSYGKEPVQFTSID